MKRILALAVLTGLLAFAVAAQAATEVKMTGDARIHATVFTKQNYTGWSGDGTQANDTFTIWERFRLRSDFIANENLKFRLGIRVNNTAWGNNTFTVDNPRVSIDVYQAYLQFKVPNTDIEITAGRQPITLPHASFFGGSSVVLDTEVAAAVINAPIIKDTLSVVAGFGRPLDSNKDFDPTLTQVPDEFDIFFLALPITLEGFSATPWGAMGIAGRNANYANTFVGGAGSYNNSLANTLFSGATGIGVPLRNPQNLYWWAGSAFEVTALDPFKFYADVIYGQGNWSDRQANRRGGWFLDVAAEYTGLDMLTPQVAFWWSTGEDDSLKNGSERMPQIVSAWGTSTSFLFDSDQAFVSGNMGVNPTGTWGFSASLNKISFVTDLSHRLTFAFAQGMNSARALRAVNLAVGTGNWYQMGRDLATTEHVFGLNLDNNYAIYENLDFKVNTGWSHGEFDRSVWGRRFVNQAKDGDAFLVSFGLQYKF